MESYSMFYKGKISVIVPVYNTQECLERCLDSILNQTYKNYEILLVDDGSTDFSGRICEAYAEKYPESISYYPICHGGQGNARNVGIENATGEYIAFVDSDDDIHENMYKEMVECAACTDADVVICDVRLFATDGNTSEIQHSVNYGTANVRNYMQYGINLCSPCNKIFRRELFEKRRFKEITYEDMELIPVIISRAVNVQFLNKNFYNYRMRRFSTTNDEKQFRLNDFLYAVTSSIEHVAETYRDELVYWHARSILNGACGKLEKYRGELAGFLKKNESLFAGNRLMEADYYVRQIYHFTEEMKCHATQPVYKFTIISSLPEKYWSGLLSGQELAADDIQLIYRSVGADCAADRILGKYFCVIDEEIAVERDFFTKLFVIGEMSGAKSSVIGVPLKDTCGENQVLNLNTDYKKLDSDAYFYLYRTLVPKKPVPEGSIPERLFWYYALSENDALILANQLHIKKAAPVPGDVFRQNREIVLGELLEAMKLCMSWRLGIPKCIQFYVLQKIKRIIETEYEEAQIDAGDFEKFRKDIGAVLAYIEDDMILSVPKMTPEHRVFLFRLKYGREAEVRQWEDKTALVWNEKCVYCQDDTYTLFEFMDYEGAVLRLEGRTICLNCTENEEILFYAKANGTVYPAKELKRRCSRYCLGELLYRGMEFEVRLPISPAVGLYEITFFYIYRGREIARNDIRFAKYAPLTRRFAASYYKEGDRVLTYAGNGINFRLCGRKGKLLHERDFLREIRGTMPVKKYREIRRLRILYLLFHTFSQKRIWLISDKAHRADDNGEAFFRYMNSGFFLRRKVKTYYIIDKKCRDYQRIKKLGKTVQFHSMKHKLLSLCCEYQFAAHAHISIVCPLAEERDCFKDILKKDKVVFLQHGVTQNNYSSALNRYVQNFRAIITSNVEERDSYIAYDYFYDEDRIILSGLPRHDYLYDNKKKYITFAPTWRRYLFGDFVQQEERYLLKDDFKESEYYRFFSAILNSEKLLAAVNAYGYELHFIPHPVFFPYIDEFRFHDGVKVHGVDVSYNAMYAQSSLFITDYSSAVFDFAYMEKPVLYVQFDREEFYASQYERGMFDYENEGFGPVTDTVEDTVDRIIAYMKNDCQMEDVYKERVRSFFEFHDGGNCARIFEEFSKIV